MMKPKIEPSWMELLSEEFEAEYFTALMEFVNEERTKQTVYPPEEQVFSAFNLTPVDKVKVVILGQDPYHGPNQAHGLCFSVKNGKIPPSLNTIFRNLNRFTQMEKPTSGDLTKWAEQGVLLLNTVLTVRHKAANSHKRKGWEQFTDAAIRKLSDERENLVFLLWGKQAQAKGSLIKGGNHLILETSHPAARAANLTFKDSDHFNETNIFLKTNSLKPIDWNLNTQ